MRHSLESYERRELILPALLARAEHAPPDEPARGSVIVATLAGDVHAIGRALLLTVLSKCGYTVHDLGKQVPIDRIVEAASHLRPDAICLSALLVTTSRQMPLCVQALDRSGLHVPVLIGGAAINRAFGRRSAILADGRIYAPGVFYCRDVFEGLTTLDALTDPARRQSLIDETRAAVEGERAGVLETRVTTAATSVTAASVPSVPSVDPPAPPYLGVRVSRPSLAEVWQHLDHNTLFRYHWGGHQARGDDYERIVREQFQPLLRQLLDDAVRADWLSPRVVSGYFACNAAGNAVLIYTEQGGVAAHLSFPRQSDGERLCLADYFRSVDSGERDVIALQAVTVGARAGEYVAELQSAGQYARMLFVNGLASAAAEALAEYANQAARRDLGLPPGRGLRFSWGYAACPDLAEQRKVLPLLDAGAAIGLTLTESDNLDPEHSTAALIVHHPEAKYFSVRSASA